MKNVMSSGSAPTHSSMSGVAASLTWDATLATFMESAAPIAQAAVPDGPLDKTIAKLLNAAMALHASHQQALAAVAQVVLTHWDADMIREMTFQELLPTSCMEAAYQVQLAAVVKEEIMETTLSPLTVVPSDSAGAIGVVLGANSAPIAGAGPSAMAPPATAADGRRDWDGAWREVGPICECAATHHVSNGRTTATVCSRLHTHPQQKPLLPMQAAMALPRGPIAAYARGRSRQKCSLPQRGRGTSFAGGAQELPQTSA